MIAHEAKPHQPHGHFLVCLSHQFDESEEVVRVVKDIIATVTAIEDVVNKTALGSTCRAWHQSSLGNGRRIEVDVPVSRSSVWKLRNTAIVGC